MSYGHRPFGESWRFARALAAFLMIAAAFESQADVDVGVVDKYLWSIKLTKTITPADALRFENIKSAVTNMEKSLGGTIGIVVNLNSHGGDIQAALQIGRVLRSTASLVEVKPKAICLSSCVLVLAGASRRVIDDEAKIGIHRPYQSAAGNIDPITVKKQYEKLGAEILSYLREMNVDERLYLDMLLVSPQNIRFLTPEETERYGLIPKDPYFEESDAMKTASDLGISRSELARREALEPEMCGPWDLAKTLDQMMSRFACGDRVRRLGH